MKKLLSIVLLLSFVVMLSSCLFIDDDMVYAESTGWPDPSNEEFYSIYCDLFAKKIWALLDKYDVEYKIKDESISGSAYHIELYNDEFSCILHFFDNSNYGAYTGKMYYYAENQAKRSDFDSQRKYVDFLNELTLTISYGVDSDSNIFEDAFNYCIENKSRAKHTSLHQDSLVGRLGYSVCLEAYDTAGAYYYKMEKQHQDVSIIHNYYDFKGCIKGDIKDLLSSEV